MSGGTFVHDDPEFIFKENATKIWYRLLGNLQALLTGAS
jgi:hypothetical protein